MITYRQPFRGEFPITQRFGEVIAGVTKNGKPHTGIDYGCPKGTEILASADGTVMAAGWDTTGYGFRVIIKHPDGQATLYAHLDTITVPVTAAVKQGDVIGTSGWTGSVVPAGPGGAHLHFEARKIWNNFTTAFDPQLLPLMCVEDNLATTSQSFAKLKEAQDLGPLVRVAAPLGAKGFHSEAFSYFSTHQQGEEFYNTGETVRHNGYTYLKVRPLARPVWVAVHDGVTQILE